MFSVFALYFLNIALGLVYILSVQQDLQRTVGPQLFSSM